jgi:tripartite-type tricarboxylate transporter receptor subunit TctC
MARCRLALMLALLGLLATERAGGQGYPVKPVRLVTAEPGGGNDFAARLVAPGVSGGLGQQLIIENRGPGILPSETVARAAPDGYTLLLHGSSIWLSSFFHDNLPYDALRDFAPVTILTSAPNVLVVHPSLPVKSVRDLIALAKARPGALNYGASGAASSPRLAAELFKAMAGVDIVRVNYRGTGPALIALVSGEVQLSFASPGGTIAHIKAGRVRPVAVASAQPSALFPGLPTVAESGLPGYEYSAAYAVLAPAKTSEAILKRLTREFVSVLQRPEVRARFLQSGVEPVGSSPAQLTAKMQYDIDRLGTMIRKLGLGSS